MRILSFARILFSLRKLPNPHNQQNLENFYKYGSCYYFKPEACANFYICKPEDLLHFTGSRSEPFSGIRIIFSRDAPAIWLLWKPFNRLSGIRLFLCLLNYGTVWFCLQQEVSGLCIKGPAIHPTGYPTFFIRSNLYGYWYPVPVFIAVMCILICILGDLPDPDPKMAKIRRKSVKNNNLWVIYIFRFISSNQIL